MSKNNEIDNCIKQVFEFFDKNKKNYLTSKEIENALISLGLDLNQAHINEINKLAKNNNNKFSFDKFKSICDIYKINSINLENKLKEAFTIFEYDKKDYANVNEIINLLKQTNKELTDNDINKILREVNADENGFFNYVNFTDKIIDSTNLVNKKNK